MSLYRKFLRYLLTSASLVGFFLGYIFISHSNESETTVTTSDGQTLSIDMPAIPSVDNLAVPNTGESGLQIFSFNQDQSGFMPQMRTGGS